MSPRNPRGVDWPLAFIGEAALKMLRPVVSKLPIKSDQTLVPAMNAVAVSPLAAYTAGAACAT